MELWHAWIIAGIALLIAEIFTPGFVVACFGVACFPAALLAWFGLELKLQIAAFSVSTLVVLFGIRPLFIRYSRSAADKARTNIDALIGKTGLVTERIDPTTRKGRVSVSGDDWWAFSADEKLIEPGVKVAVVGVDGTKLHVKPISEEQEQ